MKKFLPLIAFVALAGCMNMPTNTAQITPTYNSGIAYENYSCGRLAVEMDSLSRRERQLVVAQESRIKTSQMQAFWWGFGQGDGIEASELASIRGEIEAIRTASGRKRCGIKYTRPVQKQPVKVRKNDFQQ